MLSVLGLIRKAGGGGGGGGGGSCPLHARCEKRVGEGSAVCFRSDTTKSGNP